MKTFLLVVLINGSVGYNFPQHFHQWEACVRTGGDFTRGLRALHKAPLPFKLDFECMPITMGPHKDKWYNTFNE